MKTKKKKEKLSFIFKIGIVLSPGDDIDKQIERRGAEKHHRKADDKNK